ncbi:RHS repeat-associated core domain-containing protein [Paraburkholderia rhizosphaerae]|uniref:RHS repeat-associated protein n=1 Tax=Paraburkholderia rhizosphaerae TaxID=480658 RepID=A0A4V6QD41_9BURK|nr:RHS repeat-associated core domain-containing protein [Paraburkholderia rhizosphaerae]TDY50771.1 RHS repeat-associated protein [Paraburkholderia rhizosphaerae]
MASSSGKDSAGKTDGNRGGGSSGGAVSASADGSFSQSGALSYLSFRRGEVDPRTGSFNYRISVARLVGNRQMGPSIDLALGYDHFSKKWTDFGQGWALNLSRFIDSDPYKQVVLRDGRIIDLKLNSSSGAYEIQTVGVTDFKFTKLDNPPGGFQIAYKDGIVETLAVVKDGDTSCYVTKITNEKGYSLNLEYRISPLLMDVNLAKISDEYENNLITCGPLAYNFNTGIGSVEVTLYSGSGEVESNITFNTSTMLVPGVQTLESCSVGIDPPVKTVKLAYELRNKTDTAPGFMVITQVQSDFGGPATETISYGDDIKAPQGAPWDVLPAVKTYELKIKSAGTDVDRSEKREYSYGDSEDFKNFLGYDGEAVWDDNAIDNIYARPSDYSYFTTEIVTMDNGANSSQSISRTYDKFHRLVSEVQEVTPFSSSVKFLQVFRAYLYQGEVDADYQSLPSQYQLPANVVVHYTETQPDPDDPENEIEYIRETTQATDYDEYGNILRQAEQNGMVSEYQYYPAEGVEDECPVEKNGFVRYVQMIERHRDGDSTNLIRNLYLYVSTQIKDGYSYAVVASVEEHRKLNDVWTNESQQTDYVYYDVTPDQGDNLGRLKSSTLILNGVSGIVTSYRYRYSTDGRTLTTARKTKGVEGTSLTEATTVSALTGWLLRTVDNLGVATSLAYDSVGRLTSLTRAPGTEFESKTTYSYAVDAETYLHTRTENVPSMAEVKLTYDALGNVVKQEVGGTVTRKAEFDTQGLLAKEIFHDEGVPKTDGTEVSLDLTDVYEYDGFGNMATASYHDGTGIDRHFNIGNAVLTEYRSTATGDAADLKFNCTETQHDKATMVPLVVREYDSDGSTLRTETTYGYDVLYRLSSVHIADAAGTEEEYEVYSYDFSDRIQTRVEQVQTEMARTTTYTYWEYGVEPKLTSLAVDGVVLAKQSYDDLGRLSTTDRNPDLPESDKLTTYTYAAGYSVPDTVLNPRKMRVDCTYFPQLGCLPKTVVPEQDGASVTYAYDKDKVKLTSETCTSGTDVMTRTIEYDANALISSETITAPAGQSYKNEFTRTAAGALKSITVTDGNYPPKKVDYFYDDCGRISRLSFSRNGAKELVIDLRFYFGALPGYANYDFQLPADPKVCYANLFAYDYKLRLLHRNYGLVQGEDPGDYQPFSYADAQYDDLGRVVEQLVGTVSATDPDADRVTKITHAFDKLGRLASSTVDEASTTVYPKDRNGNDVTEYTFTYDAYDNLVSSESIAKETGAITTTGYEYAGKNKFEMTKASQGGGADVMLTYDDSGNVSTIAWADASKPSVTLSYDIYEQLVGAQDAGGESTPAKTVALSYGIDGKLQKESLTTTEADQSTAQQVTAFGYCDGEFNTSWRKQTPGDTDAQSASYVGAGAATDAMSILQGSKDNYTKTRSLLLRDVAGSVYGEADPDTGVAPDVTPIAYSPYGYAGDLMAQPSCDPIRFKGARFDPLTSLYHLGDGNRSYDPSLMRFLQYDVVSPFGDGGLNPYAYCGADPVTYFDLTGNDRNLPIVLGVLGIVFGLFAFGFGIAAALAAASSVFGAVAAGGAIIGGLAGIAGGACGIAGATVEDEETARQLQTASFSLDIISLILGVGFAVLPALHRVTRHLVAKISTARVLRANTQFTHMEKTGFAISPAVRIDGIDEPVHLLKAHGGIGKLTMPSRIPDKVRRLTGTTDYYYRETVTTENFDRFATRVDELLRTTYTKSDPNGAVLMLACEGSLTGHMANAQALAKLWNRPTYSFPGPTVHTAFAKAAKGPGSDMVAYAAPWFPKVRGPHPRA